MTNKKLSYVLKRIDLSKGRIVRTVDDMQAVLLEDYPTYQIYNGKKYESEDTYLILLKNNEKAGILQKLYDDIHAYVLRRYRNQHVLSRLTDNGFLKALWPDITSVTCCNPKESIRIRHLVENSGLTLRDKRWDTINMSISQYLCERHHVPYEPTTRKDQLLDCTDENNEKHYVNVTKLKFEPMHGKEKPYMFYFYRNYEPITEQNEELVMDMILKNTKNRKQVFTFFDERAYRAFCSAVRQKNRTNITAAWIDTEMGLIAGTMHITTTKGDEPTWRRESARPTTT